MTAPEHTARILVIEDSLGIIHALQRALGLYRDGIYQVESCSSGEDALKRLQESPFDLLVSDLRLPGIDGLELIARARSVQPGIRAVLITAYGSTEVEERARILANAYLPKPFHLLDLLRLVDKVLSESLHQPEPVNQISSLTGESVDSLLLALPSEAHLITRAVKRKNAHWIVLACDLDGTLAEDGQIAPQTWEALRAARLSGLVLILVSGRTLDRLTANFPFSELCEAIVAENGAVIHFPRRDTVTLPFGHVDNVFLRRLETLGVPLERGIAIAATWVPHDKTVMKVLRESRGGAAVEYNRDSVMVLPLGASKGNGLLVALAELGYSPHNVLACGDAENDRSLFEVVELGVAVPNAQPALKLVADTVLLQPDGVGVQALIYDLIEGRPLTHKMRPENALLLGYRMSGAPLHLDPFILVENSLGIFGSSGSGKSWLAGLLAEELLRHKYQVCVIDSEGDYRSLGASPHTLLLGGPEKSLPVVSEVLDIGEESNINLILDLSMYSIEQRITYLKEFLHALRSLRGRRGRPHCFLVDEVQNYCPAGGGGLTDLFLEAMQWGGFIVVSYRLSQIAPKLLDALEHWLVTRMRMPKEIKILNSYLSRFVGGSAAVDQLQGLPKGQAYLCLSPALLEKQETVQAIRFHVGPRAIPHIRHLHKYLRAPLPEWKRFYFQKPGGRYLGRAAASLWEFRELLNEVPIDSLRYHLERGDFESWLQQVLHDEELARRVHKVGDHGLRGEDLRRALLEVVIERYEELEALI